MWVQSINLDIAICVIIMQFVQPEVRVLPAPFASCIKHTVSSSEYFLPLFSQLHLPSLLPSTAFSYRQAITLTITLTANLNLCLGQPQIPYVLHYVYARSIPCSSGLGYAGCE